MGCERAEGRQENMDVTNIDNIDDMIVFPLTVSS